MTTLQSDTPANLSQLGGPAVAAPEISYRNVDVSMLKAWPVKAGVGLNILAV